VKEDKIVKNALDGKVLFYVKRPDSTGYIEQNRVYLYPTFLVLNSNGEPLHTWIGWPGSEGWAEHLGLAASEPLTVDERKARFAAKPTFTDAYMLGTIEYARMNTRDGHNYYREAIALDEAASRREGVPILLFNTAYRGVGTGDFTVEECATVAKEILRAAAVKTEDALEITERLARVVNDIGEEVVDPILRMTYPIVERDTSEDLYIERQRFYGNYAMIVEKDPGKALGYKRETMPEGWMDDSRHLNSFTWWCFENNVNLEEAEELSRRSIELAGESPTKANCMDTLAEIVNLRGDTAGALDLIKQALEIDPDNDYLRRQRTRFEAESEQPS
jgi:tetratricopeptide (TPR) repeat protein